MKEKLRILWRWCPHPERIRVTRTRPSERPWMPLAASAVILSLLMIQSIQPYSMQPYGVQLWTPPAMNAAYPTSYDTFSPVQPIADAPREPRAPAQVVTVVSTEHMKVQLSFPDIAEPGKTVTVTASTTAKSNGKVISLSIEVFSYVDKQLAKVAGETVVKDKQVRSGESWQTALAAAIPSTAPRGEMIGTVTEVWEQVTTYNYQPYGYSNPPYYPYSPYYPYYPYYPWGPSNYTVYYVYEPSYLVSQKSSQQTVPLTYVLSPTPEYEDLAAQHAQLRQEYDAIVAKYNAMSSKYDSLKAEYDQIVAKYNESVAKYNESVAKYNQNVSEYEKLQSQYNSAQSEISNYKTVNTMLLGAVIGLAVALVVTVVLLLTRRRTRAPVEEHAEATQPQKKHPK